MTIPNKAQRDQWRADTVGKVTADRYGTHTTATPKEFTFLLDAMDELEVQRDALAAALRLMVRAACPKGDGGKFDALYDEAMAAAQAALNPPTGAA